MRTTNPFKMINIVSCSPKSVKYAERCYTFFQTAAYTASVVVVTAFFITCRRYNNEVYTMETDYLRWVTKLPAFSVCPAADGRFVSQQLSKFSKQAAPQNVSFFVNFLRPGKQFCPSCPVSWPVNLPTNSSELIKILTPPCEAQLEECFWNGKPFACCQHFKPLLTKRGLCYSLNSDQTDGESSAEPFDMVTSVQNPQANLEISSNVAFSLYITDRKSVIMKHPRFFIKLGKRGDVQYKFTETIALNSASELTSSQRFCTLDQEISLPGFRKYSYSACKVKCLAERQIKLCGCRHHLVQSVGPTCGVPGLQCLDKLGNSTKFKCGCKPECAGQEIQYVHFSEQPGEPKKAKAEVILTKPPTERTIYYAETTFIETIVGFACMTRLITTANLYDSVQALRTMLRNYAEFLSYLLKKSHKRLD